MEKLKLKLDNIEYEVLIGKNILYNRLNEITRNNNCFYIIDKYLYENYYYEYFDFLKNVSKEYIYIFESKEENKTMDSVIAIINRMSDLYIMRSYTIICIGGGIVGDISGFVSSIYMRGIRFIYVPTTLLAQVDSSIGGKNGVNTGSYKNLIGTFNQPKEVIIDTKFLKSLDRREVLCGLAEILKYGIIQEYDILKVIDNNFYDILNIEDKVILQLIEKSCKIKIEVVEKDECDFGIRKILNHGHTVGHAIEITTKFKTYLHGEAVLIGIFYEVNIAYRLGFIEKSYYEFIVSILYKFGLDFHLKHLDKEEFFLNFLKDKKNKNNKISFIFPVGISKVNEYLFTLEDVKSFINLY